MENTTVFVEQFVGKMIEGATRPTNLKEISVLKYIDADDVYFVDRVPVTDAEFMKVMNIEFVNDFDGILSYGNRIHYSSKYAGAFTSDLVESRADICDAPVHLRFGDLIVTSNDEVFQVRRMNS